MNELVQQRETPVDMPTTPSSSGAMVLDIAAMESIMSFAKVMASGRSTVPAHLQRNEADCAAVVTQAVMWKMNPYAVAQKTHVVNGQLGYEAQLVNAVISTSGALRGRPEYEWFGPWEKVMGKFNIKQKPATGNPGDKDYKKATEYRVPGWVMSDEKGCGVRIWATIKGEEVPRYLELLLEQASVRNSPLWATDPKQQLAYLAVKRWARLYVPDVLLGVYTPDELDQAPMQDLNSQPEQQPLPKNAKPAEVAARRRQAEPAGPSEELLASARAAADKGRDVFQEWWRVAKPADRGALRNEITDLQARVETAENNNVIDMAPPSDQVDDDFVRQMDEASGQVGE